MECVHCHKDKPDTVVRVNPFMKEIHDETIEEPICDDCEEALRDDI